MTFRPRGMFNCVRYISIKDYNRLTSRDGDAGLSLITFVMLSDVKPYNLT